MILMLKRVVLSSQPHTHTLWNTSGHSTNCGITPMGRYVHSPPPPKCILLSCRGNVNWSQFPKVHSQLLHVQHSQEHILQQGIYAVATHRRRFSYSTLFTRSIIMYTERLPRRITSISFKWTSFLSKCHLNIWRLIRAQIRNSHPTQLKRNIGW